MQVCVDTHALLWYATNQTKKLGRKSLKILQACEINKSSQLLVSIMALLEAYHVSLKKPEIKFSDFLIALKSIRGKVIPFDSSILKACYRLPDNINIHDRVIAATALAYNCPLITKDKTLAKQTKIKIIW